MESTSRPADSLQVSPEQVAAFRLKRHHLAARASASALPQVAGDMAGVQAQVLSAAQMSLWTRSRGLRIDDVEKALWQDRTLVKVWCMRGTVHLVPSEDFAVFVRGCTRRTNRAIAWMDRAGISVGPVDRIIEAMRQALVRPLTRKELADRVSDSLGVKIEARGGRGWGGSADAAGFQVGDEFVSVGGILFLACMRGVACSGPERGNEATFVRPDAWIPRWHDLTAEKAEQELLRRYLRAFGPATVTDFAVWTYMTARDAREIWKRIEEELAPVSVEGRTKWMLRADVPSVRRAKIEHPSVRLLPYFDAFLLGHKEKGHIVDAAHYKRVYRPQGWLSPVVLVDGRVTGVWSYDRKRQRLAVRAEAFRRFPTAVRFRIEEEAEDLRRFLDIPEVVVTFK